MNARNRLVTWWHRRCAASWERRRLYYYANMLSAEYMVACHRRAVREIADEETEY